MITQEDDKYKVFLLKRNKKAYTLLDGNYSIVSTIRITRDIDTPVIDGDMAVLKLKDFDLIDIGDVVDIFGPVLNYNDTYNLNQHLYRLFVLEKNIDDSGLLKLKMKNIAYWVMNPSYYIKLNVNETASEIVKRTADKYKIAIDSIDDSYYRLPSRLYENITLYNLWLNCISLSYIKDNRQYYLYFTPKGLRLQRITTNRLLSNSFYYNSKDNNIISPSRTISVLHENFFNSIRGIVKADSNLIGGLSGFDNVLSEQLFRDSLSISLYGEFRKDIVFSSSELNAGDIDKLLHSEPDDNIDFSSFSTNRLKPTDRIFIDNYQIDVNGAYFVESITNEMQSNNYTELINATKVIRIPSDVPSEEKSIDNIIEGLSNE